MAVLEPWLTAWTIRLAIAAMLLALGLRIEWSPAGHVSSKKTGRRTVADWIWWVGSLFALAHAIVTMTLVHQGSHQNAFEATARQTQNQMGVRVGIGIYFNYLFVLLWLVHASWRLFQKPRDSQEANQAWGATLSRLVVGFLIFIAFNGTVVFVQNSTRWLWLLAWLAVVLGWLRFRSNRIIARPV